MKQIKKSILSIVLSICLIVTLCSGYASMSSQKVSAKETNSEIDYSQDFNDIYYRTGSYFDNGRFTYELLRNKITEKVDAVAVVDFIDEVSVNKFPQQPNFEVTDTLETYWKKVQDYGQTLKKLLSVTVPNQVTVKNETYNVIAMLGTFTRCANKLDYILDGIDISPAWADRSLTGYNISSVKVSNGIKVIIGAFNGCSRFLTEVELPDSVEQIGDLSFKNCNLISKLSMPVHLKRIGICSFYGVGSHYSTGLDPITNKQMNMYSEDIENEFETITIPDSVENISSGAFCDAVNIKAFDVNKAKRIGDYAFANTGIAELDTKNVEYVGYKAVAYCKNLKKVNIQTDAKLLGESFIDDKLLNDVIISNTDTAIYGMGLNFVNTPWSETQKENGIYYCGSLADYTDALGRPFDNKNISIKDGTKVIGCNFSSYRDPGYTDKNTVRFIKNGTDSSLESIIIPSSVEVMKTPNAFSHTNLKNITFKNENIVASAEYLKEEQALIDNSDVCGATYCPQLWSCTNNYGLPDNFKNIDTSKKNMVTDFNSQLAGADKIETITLPNQLTELPNYFLADCKNLKEINGLEHIQKIDHSALQGTAFEKAQPKGAVYINDILYGINLNFQPEYNNDTLCLKSYDKLTLEQKSEIDKYRNIVISENKKLGADAFLMRDFSTEHFYYGTDSDIYSQSDYIESVQLNSSVTELYSLKSTAIKTLDLKNIKSISGELELPNLSVQKLVNTDSVVNVNLQRLTLSDEKGKLQFKNAVDLTILTDNKNLDLDISDKTQNYAVGGAYNDININGKNNCGEYELRANTVTINSEKFELNNRAIFANNIFFGDSVTSISENKYGYVNNGYEKVQTVANNIKFGNRIKEISFLPAVRGDRNEVKANIDLNKIEYLYCNIGNGVKITNADNIKDISRQILKNSDEALANKLLISAETVGETGLTDNTMSLLAVPKQVTIIGKKAFKSFATGYSDNGGTQVIKIHNNIDYADDTSFSQAICTQNKDNQNNLSGYLSTYYFEKDKLGKYNANVKAVLVVDEPEKITIENSKSQGRESYLNTGSYVNGISYGNMFVTDVIAPVQTKIVNNTARLKDMGVVGDESDGFDITQNEQFETDINNRYTINTKQHDDYENAEETILDNNTSEITIEHQWLDWVCENEVSCTEKGIESRTCKVCGIKEYKYKEALGHGFGEWNVSTPATTESEGTIERECSRCHTKETNSIPKISIIPATSINDITQYIILLCICIVIILSFFVKRKVRK